MTSQMEDTRSGVDVIRTTLKSTNDDVVTMSTSFTEFIAHFDNYSVAVASNFTTLTGEMLTSITTTNALSKKVSFYNSEFQSSTKELSTKLNSRNFRRWNARRREHLLRGDGHATADVDDARWDEERLQFPRIGFRFVEDEDQRFGR